MSAVLDAVIRQYARDLKLPSIAREYEALARQAVADGWRFEEYLRELLEVELRSRRDNVAAQRLKEAHFPAIKTLDEIDWEAMSYMSRPLVAELATSAFISRAENVIIAGPIGTGKTHLATAFGVEAARRRHRVFFTKAADLVRELLEARDSRQLGRLHLRLQRARLLILDELGFVPFDRAGGELLFNLLAERHERRSTIVTTNLAFSEWVEVLGDEKLTTALLDRLASKAHIITTQGASYRTRSRICDGVAPPPPGGRREKGKDTSKDNDHPQPQPKYT
jgi:DNA replication protein DnaC